MSPSSQYCHCHFTMKERLTNQPAGCICSMLCIEQHCRFYCQVYKVLWFYTDCAPGFHLNGTLGSGGWCVPCPSGQYCPGYDASVTPNPNNQAIQCAQGLATIITGAKSVAQVRLRHLLYTRTYSTCNRCLRSVRLLDYI